MGTAACTAENASEFQKKWDMCPAIMTGKPVYCPQLQYREHAAPKRGRSPKRPVEGGCEDCWKMLVMAGKLLAAGALVVEKVKLVLGPAIIVRSSHNLAADLEVNRRHEIIAKLAGEASCATIIFSDRVLSQYMHLVIVSDVGYVPSQLSVACQD